MKVRIASKFDKIINFLKLFLTLLNFKVHTNLSLSNGLNQTKVFFIMTQVLIILNSEFSKNNFMLFTLNFKLFISLIFVGEIKSFYQKEFLSCWICNYFNIYKNLSHSHIEDWNCWNGFNLIQFFLQLIDEFFLIGLCSEPRLHPWKTVQFVFCFYYFIFFLNWRFFFLWNLLNFWFSVSLFIFLFWLFFQSLDTKIPVCYNSPNVHFFFHFLQ